MNQLSDTISAPLQLTEGRQDPYTCRACGSPHSIRGTWCRSTDEDQITGFYIRCRSCRFRTPVCEQLHTAELIFET